MRHALRLTIVVVALTLALASSDPASAQRRGPGQGPGPRAGGGGFSFDKCFSRCMGWNDAYHCSRGCGRKQAEVQWQQKLSAEGRGRRIERNDPLHPRSPRFHDPEHVHRQ